MQSNDPMELAYTVSICHGDGSIAGRIQISSIDDEWLINFGVDGPNVGLFTVRVPKNRVEHLNILGLLEKALGSLEIPKKNGNIAGERVNVVPVRGALGP